MYLGLSLISLTEYMNNITFCTVCSPWSVLRYSVNFYISFVLGKCSNPLQNLGRITAGTIVRRSHGRPQRSDDFDCTVCLKLMYKPITTPCGHSFCRSCLFQVMDQGEFFSVLYSFLLLNRTIMPIYFYQML